MRTRLLSNDFKSDLNQTQHFKPQERSLFYRDVAILRFWDKPTKILNENQFTFTFLKRQNDPIWKELMLVQTNVRSKIGIGKILSKYSLVLVYS